MIEKLLFSFLLIGCLIQVNDAKPSFLVIAEYIPKLASSAVKILKTAKYGIHEIAQFENQIRAAVNVAQNKINGEIIELDKFVQKSVDEAQKTGKNISSCVDEELSELLHIKFGVIDECRTSKAVEHLLVNIIALVKEEISLAIEVTHCIFQHPIMGSKLKDCFDSEIVDIDNKIWKFNNELEATIQETQKKSFTCIKTDLENLSAEIENIRETFKNCSQDFFKV